jgi:hypothetical protein
MTPRPCWIVLAIFALSACVSAPTGPRFEPALTLPTDKATVYVYRPYWPVDANLAPLIHVNDERKFSLLNKQYAVVSLTPGIYEFRADIQMSCYASVSRQLSLRAGEDYFVRFAVPSYGKSGRPSFAPTPTGNTAADALLLLPALLDLHRKCRLMPDLSLMDRDQALREITDTHLIE